MILMSKNLVVENLKFKPECIKDKEKLIKLSLHPLCYKKIFTDPKPVNTEITISRPFLIVLYRYKRKLHPVAPYPPR